MSIQINHGKQQTITNDNYNGLQPIRGSCGASILGPRNVPLEQENPSLLLSPETDAGTVPNLKFSFAAARNRIASSRGRCLVHRHSLL